jgi:hypothetical protein
VSVLFSVVAIVGMFILLRKTERWLHQHLFKVGWLLTKNYKTTTTLYYTFFLPGVLLHEFLLYIVAGMLNVRAETTIKYPEPQDIGELKLNFVQISPRADATRRMVIALAPLVVGLVICWIIANNAFHITAAMQTMSSGELDAVAAGLRQLTGAPDFWLWFYILFTVSNTMYPTLPKDFHGWRTIAGGIVALIVATILLGIGGELYSALATPLEEFLGSAHGMLLLLIGVNIVMVLALGTVEAVVERITGNSATFKKGKMITMTRAEALEQQRKDAERQRRQLTSPQPPRYVAANSGIPSIYRVIFNIPGAPGEEPISQPITALSGISEAKPAALPASGKAGAEVITTGTPALAPTGPVFNIPASLRSTDESAAKPPDEPAPAKPAPVFNIPASLRSTDESAAKPPENAPLPPRPAEKALGGEVNPAAPTAPFAKPVTPPKTDEPAPLPPRPAEKALGGEVNPPAAPLTPFAKPVTPPTNNPLPPRPAEKALGGEVNPPAASSPFARPLTPAAAAKPITPFETPPAAPPPLTPPKPAAGLSPFARPLPNQPAAETDAPTKPSLPPVAPRPSPFAPPKPKRSDDEDDESVLQRDSKGLDAIDDLFNDAFGLSESAPPKPARTPPPSNPFSRGTPRPMPSISYKPSDDDEDDEALSDLFKEDDSELRYVDDEDAPRYSDDD